MTTVAQTVVHLAAELAPEALARLCHEAGVLHRLTPRQARAAMRRNAPGARELRAVMGGDTPVSLSRLEAAFIAVVRANGLPLPETNKGAGGRRVDCRWPAHRLTV